MFFEECLEACKTNPLGRIEPDSTPSVKSLLLSKTAVGPGVTYTQLSNAFNELIDLKYPVINRILEAASYLCSLGFLHIYCAAPSDFKSLIHDPNLKGVFNQRYGLVLVVNQNNLSQLLIHELTHAIRH